MLVARKSKKPDPKKEHPTLDADEDDSETAEFTPRTRLDHPNVTQEKRESLIDPDWSLGDTATKGKLLVRVTGLLCSIQNIIVPVLCRDTTTGRLMKRGFDSLHPLTS